MLGPSADLLSLLYAAVALYTLWQLPGRWKALWDAEYTADDRNLANRVGFLLLTPLGVLAHEAAHLLAAQALGAERTALSFRIYWGYVQYAPRLGPTAEWIVAAAGPAASLALGLAALGAGLALRRAWRDVVLSFAHATLLLVLVLYPGLSFVEGAGDYLTIYGRAAGNLAVVAGVVHGLGLLAYLLGIRRLAHQERAAARATLSARFAGRVVAMQPEAHARLARLERDVRFRRLTPEEREELRHLLELKAWSLEHNRAVGSQAARDEAGLPLADAPDDGAGGPPAAVPSDGADGQPDVSGGTDRAGARGTPSS